MTTGTIWVKDYGNGQWGAALDLVHGQFKPGSREALHLGLLQATAAELGIGVQYVDFFTYSQWGFLGTREQLRRWAAFITEAPPFELVQVKGEA